MCVSTRTGRPTGPGCPGARAGASAERIARQRRRCSDVAVSEMETVNEEHGGEAQQRQPAEADTQQDEREGDVDEKAEQRSPPAGMVQDRQEDEAEREAEERHLEGSQADDREGGAA